MDESQKLSISAAIDVLLDQLHRQQEEVTETKRTVNGLRRRIGEQPMFADAEEPESAPAPMRPDLYYGRPLSPAAQMYLERRGQACPPEEIMKGMAAGGFDFKSMGWRSGDELRSFALTLGKNSKVFHRLPNGTVGLLAWYPAIPTKKAKPEAIADEAGGSGEPEPETEEKAS